MELLVFSDSSGGSLSGTEDFTNQSLVNTAPNGNANWTITANHSNFLDQNDYFKVVNGVLQTQDLNALHP